MRNQFAGTCYRCGQTVAPGDGHFERIPFSAPVAISRAAMLKVIGAEQ